MKKKTPQKKKKTNQKTILHESGLEQVASAKDEIDNKRSAFEDSINTALDEALAAAAKKATANNDALKGSVEKVQTDVTKEVDAAKDAADAAAKCTGSGLAWNGKKCVAQNVLVGVDDDLKCNDDNVGRVKYDKESKGLQVCDSTEWAGVGNSACSKEYV